MSRINTLRGPRLHRAPQFHRSKLARAPHSHMPASQEEGLLKRNRGLVITLATTAFLLGACAVDPSSVQAMPQQDGLKMLIEANPYKIPQILAIIGGATAGIRTLIVEGSQNFGKALNPDVHNYNLAKATWGTIVDVAATASTGAFIGGSAGLFVEVGLAPKITGMVESQFPLIGGAGAGILILNMYKWIDDVVSKIRFPTPPAP